MPSEQDNRHTAFFATEHLKDDIARRSVRGGASTFVGQFAKFFLQLGSTMILARLLTPADFGLVAMVAAVTGFMMIFKDLGLSMATVQRDEISHGQVSTLFWVNVAISACLMLATLALAPVISWFYEDARLIAVTVALSTVFLFAGLTVQHQALLRRQMRLSVVATIDVGAMAFGVLCAVMAAWLGWGYWALVLMQIGMAAGHAAGVWIACRWRPGLPVRRSGVRSMLAFGGYLTGFSFVNYFARNADKILIGRVWGPRPLGIYTKAYSLLLMPIGQITSPITAVAVPALSRLQTEPERYRRFYLKAVRLIAYLTMPGVAAMAALSDEIIGLILGPQWHAAAPIFMVLAVTALWQPVGATVGWVYISLGQTRRMFNWVCIAAPALVAAFLAGLAWGALGVALAYSLCNLLLLYPSFSYALKRAPIRTRDAFRTIWHPLAASAIIALVIVALRPYLLAAGPFVTVLASLGCGGFAFLILLFVFGSIRQDIKELIATGKLVFRR